MDKCFLCVLVRAQPIFLLAVVGWKRKRIGPSSVAKKWIARNRRTCGWDLAATDVAGTVWLKLCQVMVVLEHDALKDFLQIRSIVGMFDAKWSLMPHFFGFDPSLARWIMSLCKFSSVLIVGSPCPYTRGRGMRVCSTRDGGTRQACHVIHVTSCQRCLSYPMPVLVYT